MMNIPNLPSLITVRHDIPEGTPIFTYEFVKSSALMRYRAPVTDDLKFDPRGYRGEFWIYDGIEGRVEIGDVVELGNYRVRIVDNDILCARYMATLDKPLSRLRVWRVKVSDASMFFEARIWRTLRLWGVIDWDDTVLTYGRRYPEITRVFGRKVQR